MPRAQMMARAMWCSARQAGLERRRWTLRRLDGTNGFRLTGIDDGDRSGCSVSSAGDMNGDGFDDLIVGAPYAGSAVGADFEGESYVVFGKASWAGTPAIDLATLDGTNGFRLIRHRCVRFQRPLGLFGGGRERRRIRRCDRRSGGCRERPRQSGGRELCGVRQGGLGRDVVVRSCDAGRDQRFPLDRH